MVNRCVCFKKTFAEILNFAQINGYNQEKIEEILKCGTGCGLCKPYIAECLKSGKTEFDPKTFYKPNKH